MRAGRALDVAIVVSMIGSTTIPLWYLAIAHANLDALAFAMLVTSVWVAWFTSAAIHRHRE